MIHKRPYVDDSQEVACKHPRQWEDTSHFASVVNSVHPNSAIPNPQLSGFYSEEGKWEDIYSNSQHEGRFPEDPCNKVLNGTAKEYESSASGCVPHFWWVSGNGIRAGTESELALHLPLFPEYFTPGHQIRAFHHSDEIISLLNPRKLVSVGPEHQADIPEWSQQGLKSSSDCVDKSDPQVSLKSCGGLMVDDDDREKMMGTCLIPMPGSEAAASSCCEEVGQRIDCQCLDRGSIICIRQHVSEAREMLRENLGPELFKDLGFCDMGEEVAKRWTEEEELAFHNVVHSNPLSLGRNFWDHLPAVFPSRTKMDLVSYYFNVFMLRKRALQNHVDSVHIDSDDDQWQPAECGVPIEDDDYVVESPTDQRICLHCEHNHEDDYHDDNEDGTDSYDNGAADICQAATDEENEGGIVEISGPNAESFIARYGSSDYQISAKVQENNGDDYDFQANSHTSHEHQRDKADCCGPSEKLVDANLPSQD